MEDYCEGTYYQVQYWLGLSFTNPDLKGAISLNCDWAKCLAPQAKNSVLSQKCITYINKASYEMGNVNVYNVYGTCKFDSCDGPAENPFTTRIGPRQSNSPLMMNNEESFSSRSLMQEDSGTYDHIYNQVYGSDYVLNKQQRTRENQKRLLADQNVGMKLDGTVDTSDDDVNYAKYYAYGPAGCIDSRSATLYLMDPKVQAAIHVRNPGYCWAVCNQAKGFQYNSNQPNLPRDIYPTLISHIRVLIFNGDWDACVPVTDNQGWTEKFALQMKLSTTKPWHPGTYLLASDTTTQIGGYSVKYNVKSYGNGSFEFRTVRGAGHMVPTDAPEQGLAVLGHLISKDFDTEDSYQFPQLSATPCDTSTSSLVSSMQHERVVVMSVSIIVGLILLAIIGGLGLQVYKLQKASKRSTEVIEFNNFGDDRGDRDNVRLTSQPYVSVHKQNDIVT